MLNEFKTGDILSHQTLNALLSKMMNMIRGSNGILVQRVGNSMVISQGNQITSKRAASTTTTIPAVGALPAIPTSGSLSVFWDSTIPPYTGDNQIWDAYAGQNVWYPRQFLTTKSGTPSS